MANVREYASLALPWLKNLAPRPSHTGTLGRPIRLLANLYRLHLTPKTLVSHYDVTIFPLPAPSPRPNQQPRPLPNPLCREIWAKLASEHPELAGMAFDGRSDLEEMVARQLRTWIKGLKNVKPENVLFFRDGVGEGQFGLVVDTEVLAIKGATVLATHHIRLFAQDAKDNGRTGNLPPGTVVDTEITHPYLWDFYLQAHAGLVGTARPTRYICLLNEMGFTSDTMQKLVNSLCYSFARATRSVSLVPVAYYADIVCEKARSFVYDDDASTVASGSTGQKREKDWIQKQLDRTQGTHSLPPMWFL